MIRKLWLELKFCYLCLKCTFIQSGNSYFAHTKWLKPSWVIFMYHILSTAEGILVGFGYCVSPMIKCVTSLDICWHHLPETWYDLNLKPHRFNVGKNINWNLGGCEMTVKHRRLRVKISIDCCLMLKEDVLMEQVILSSRFV